MRTTADCMLRGAEGCDVMNIFLRYLMYDSGLLPSATKYCDLFHKDDVSKHYHVYINLLLYLMLNYKLRVY